MNIIQSSIKRSSEIVSEYWPLTSFIAVNPLWDATDKDFFSMVEKFSLKTASSNSENSYPINVLYSQQVDLYRFGSAYEHVKYECIQMISRLFSDAKNLIVTEQLKFDAYNVWLKSISISKEEKELLIEEDRYIVIQSLMNRLQISSSNSQHYFESIFKSLYGFSSLCKWMVNHPKNPWLYFKFSLVEIIIIWLWYENQLFDELLVPYENEIAYQKLPFRRSSQVTVEEKYQKELISKLITSKQKSRTPKAIMQAIFCIDTRSELIRRHLEKENVETYGYAGFFGFGFKFNQCGHQSKLQCPALLTPQRIVSVEQQQANITICSDVANAATQVTQKSILGSFNFFEILGGWFGFPYIGKTFFPKLWHKAVSFLKFNKNDIVKLVLNDFSIEEAGDAAYQMLTTIGLTKNFSKNVIMCGHQSVTENNPYASSLDCGACGGNSGMINAMIACEMLNNETVRRYLASKTIIIPEATIFIAACHFTTYDNVKVHSEDVALSKLFNNACLKVRAEKVNRFPMLTQLQKRQYDWAELVPEYALINNAAMIIGPRYLTEEINLEGRVFLHSYEKNLDKSGEILEDIMLAPMIVAHWINMQYYFSSEISSFFSAGNKAIHNVLPGIGVMEGNMSDLKVGLPEQSLYYRGKKLHSALRLTVVIYAEHKKIQKIIKMHKKLSDLVENEWLFVYVGDAVNITPFRLT